MRSEPEHAYRCLVIKDYAAVYPDPIIMSRGQNLQVGKTDPDNAGWAWCTGQNGKSGWVPVAYIEQHGDTAVAKCDYAATELSARAGEEYLVSNEESGRVWATNSFGEAGWLPVANVKKVE